MMTTDLDVINDDKTDVNSTFTSDLIRASLSIPDHEALGKLSIGGPSQLKLKTKKRSSLPQIVEFECISDQKN